ncbi:MAG: Ig-like domain-containing protein, partial [Anaerolineae bacterium]|nr:Ig-like domain-containing protein [Anaerolineae bacterium]
SISDLAGNALSGLPYTGGEVYTIDRAAPAVVSITRLDQSPTIAPSVRFLVTFSKAVSGVGTEDFAVTVTGSLTGTAVTAVGGTGATYTVTVSTGSGSGTLRLDIPATANITDLAGNALSGLPYTEGEEYEVSEARRIFLPLIVRNS